MVAATGPEIDGARVWRRHMEFAELGATPRGGVNRTTLTPEDIEVHRRLTVAAQERGFAVSLDDYGNTFYRLEGREPDMPPVVSGSHSDTQPTGGRFDGIFGVLAAFEALEALDDAGVQPRRSLEAVIWNNEEGARFTPSSMGSAVYIGAVELAPLLAGVDDNGETMQAAIDALRAALPDVAHRPFGEPFHAFVEAHIEQGPILENEGIPIGVVTGIQGTRKFDLEIIGEEAHAGTMPRAGRRDALVDAVAVVNALHDIFHDDADEIRFTIGKFEVYPGASAVVPGRVRFSVDFRHPDNALVKDLGDQLGPAARKAAARCEVKIAESNQAESTIFPDTVSDAIIRSAEARGYKWRRIFSGAGHDARYMAMHCPSGMVFVPCEGGISHNEAENARPEDIAAGTQVICDTMLDLANAP
ncbi:MAG: M20 family metallo-hydrolase [Alphaproteobacteria bacterium]|nr:M20 family metallo-hydrolase [Alphaproteobacteria bacterium]